MEFPCEDDPDHPIPFVGNLDVVLTSSAGVRLGIVVASPLRSDQRSRHRLVQKLEGYVREFAVFRQNWLAENAGSMKAWLYIHIHPESDAEIFRLIDDYTPLIEANSITVVVSRLAQ